MIAKHGLPTFIVMLLSVFLVGAQDIDYVPGELLIKLKQPLRLTKTSAALDIASLDILNRQFGAIDIQHLKIADHDATLFKGRQKRGSYLKIIFPPDSDILDLVDRYHQVAEIDYVQPNFRRRIHFVPNDSLFVQQNAMQVINAESAWDIQLASEDVIVAIIDTGVDYNHPDLQAAIWINPGEDRNGNGRVDAGDLNGLDDDNNGYIDDIQGWDFTDAPTFPDGGDYQTPDNDPSDENGHGTNVAGTIAATGNNGIGIAGLAFGCRIMNLRAGTGLGFLEEDDVATAIVYAVENGARVINMSFGDVVASPLLQDVLQYAYDQDCVLVASSGNSASDVLHFPSGFTETISVGATNNTDQLAGFSNYGSSLDIVAPGVGILTTQIGNSYADFSGTSASAPFVSALAALLLSKTPDLHPEVVRATIISSAVDLGEADWDNLYAAGRIDAGKTLVSPTYMIAAIQSPRLNEGFSSGNITVSGTAAGAFIQDYILELGQGETPEEWVEIHRQSNRQVVNDYMTSIEVSSLQDTVFTLRLLIRAKDGVSVEDKVRFFVDRSEPVFDNVRQTRMLDGDAQSVLIEFETDDLCDVTLFYRTATSDARFEVLQPPYRATTHRIHFSREIQSGELEYYVQADNRSGLSSISDQDGTYYRTSIASVPIGGLPIEELSMSLPNGFLLNKSTDFDGDGLREVVLNEYDSGYHFGPLKIFEFNGNNFSETLVIPDILIPRDWGDSDDDGLPELLAGSGDTSFILESPSPQSFPTVKIWQDNDNAWASRFADLDQDGKNEIIMRRANLFTVLERNDDQQFALIDSFPNPTEGSNGVGVPHCETGDFDGDGKLEILFGDFDGDIYIYENTGDNNYELIWTDRLPLIDTIDHLAAGDFDGDGIWEFAAGCHSPADLNTESTFDSRHWLYRIYDNSQDNTYQVVWQQAFFGFQAPADFDAGVSAGDVDNDERSELLISVFPDLYIIEYQPPDAMYHATWHSKPNRSNAVVFEDFYHDSRNVFLYNTGEKITGYRVLSDFNGPATPLALQATARDSHSIHLSWHGDGEAYRIYRGVSPDAIVFLTSVLSDFYIDNTAMPEQAYWYRITAVDSNLTPQESLPTPALKARASDNPYLVNAEGITANQVLLTFSEAMGASIKNQNNYTISDIGSPVSAIYHQNGQQVILTSPADLEPGTYTVTVDNVADLFGADIDTARNQAQFQIVQQPVVPYIVITELMPENRLKLQFNVKMDAASVALLENYTFEPDLSLGQAILAPDQESVILTFDTESPLGPYGKEYLIQVKNLKSADGVTIQPGLGDSAALIFSSFDLNNVYAYPNPFKANSGGRSITIAGLPRASIVNILDMTGRLLRTLEENDGNGGVLWDLKTGSGDPVPSGIYIYYVTSGEQSTKGKFAVLR